MKITIKLWLEKQLIWLLSKVSQEVTEDLLKEQLKNILLRMYKNTLAQRELDKYIKETIFNAKYIESVTSLFPDGKTTPSILLSSYYRQANKGNNSFEVEPFYRILVRAKDIEAKKLIYRLKIMQ